MKTVLGVAAALVTAIVPWNAEVAFAGKPSAYQSFDTPLNTPLNTLPQWGYRPVGSAYSSPYARSGIRQYPYTVNRQPLGRSYSSRRSTFGRSETVIIAPEAETVIIYQDGDSGRQRHRTLTRDGGYWDDRAFDRNGAFPPTSHRSIYRQRISTDQYLSPYPYSNRNSRTLRSCSPSSWRNAPFSSVSARQSCY